MALYSLTVPLWIYSFTHASPENDGCSFSNRFMQFLVAVLVMNAATDHFVNQLS